MMTEFNPGILRIGFEKPYLSNHENPSMGSSVEAYPTNGTLDAPLLLDPTKVVWEVYPFAFIEIDWEKYYAEALQQCRELALVEARRQPNTGAD